MFSIAGKHEYCGNCVLLQQQAGSVGASAKEIYFRDERREQSWTYMPTRGRV